MLISPCSSAPSFYRVITPSFFKKSQLSLPDKFVERYGNRLSGVVKLTVHTGDEWCVGLKKVGEEVLFNDGWKEFMEHYSIGIGYFLLFICRKNHSFDVHVFDKTATELWLLPRTNNNAERSIHTSQDAYSDGSDSSDGGSLEVRRSYRTRSKVKMICEEGSISDAELRNESRDNDYSAAWTMENANDQREAITWSNSDPVDEDMEELNIRQENEGGSVFSKQSSKHIEGRHTIAQEIERASRDARMFAPSNPYFTVSLQEYNIKKSLFLHIPTEFVMENLPYIPEQIEIQDSDGYSWKVECRISSKNSIRMNKGWATFVREKNLVAGDLCGFELIKDLLDDNVVFKVHIFRAMVENACP